jgi:redox-sensitive bicupin YhaK (pirin superfamily)
MRTIAQIHDATRFSTDKKNMRLFRVIGSTDIDDQGVLHIVNQIDPFMFLDDVMIEGELATSFDRHPHTGLTAVSYLLEGEGHAWDNIHGATPDLNRAGGVYCINSGRGVVHGEAPIEGVRKLRLLQLWFNPGIYDLPLPQANYQLFQPDELPVYEDDQIWAKIIIGTGFGFTSPVTSPWPIQYLHIKLKPQKHYSIQLTEPSFHGYIYIIHGHGEFGANETRGSAQQCLILNSESSDSISVQNWGQTPLEFILAMGKPHNKPFAKLLGHGGAIIADTENHAREYMHNYELDPDNFGRS